jgi:hypothetical protein
MPKGKPWTKDQEQTLMKLVEAHKPIDVIAESLGKTVNAVYLKCRRLGLQVEEDTRGYTTSSLKLPKDLPSVEEALRILAAALQAATEAGLDKVEVQRLQVVATLARTYEDLFADYVDYRGIEVELVELRKKYEDLVKKVSNPSAK